MGVELKSGSGSSEAIIVISGRFDFSMNSDFRKILADSAETAVKYTIDMGAVEDIDSSALGMLLLLRDKAGGDAANIDIVKCNPDIVEMLRMANFQSMFNIK